MTTDLGRPRDPRIDSAVLHATVELLGETGYAELSVDAIARRAGTSKPAIYRRWPSRYKIIEQVVFPGLASFLVEPTGETVTTGGRPAAQFRFRREVVQERPAPGLRLGARG